MNYAIVCDARQGWKMGIDTLALVDRSKTKKRWWTSDSSHLIMQFIKEAAAQYSAKRLMRNNARVVPYSEAVLIIEEQDKSIMHHEADADSCLGWDEHKDSY